MRLDQRPAKENIEYNGKKAYYKISLQTQVNKKILAAAVRQPQTVIRTAVVNKRI